MAGKSVTKPFVACNAEDEVNSAILQQPDGSEVRSEFGACAGSADYRGVDNGRKEPLDLPSAPGQPNCEALPETGRSRGNGRSTSSRASAKASLSEPPQTCSDVASDTGSPPEVRGLELNSDLPGPMERKRSSAMLSEPTSEHTRPAADNHGKLILRPPLFDRPNRKYQQGEGGDEEHDGERKMEHPAKKRKE